MVLVAEREYCAGSARGAGQLVSETRHVDAVTWHTTDFQYDWHGRTLRVYPPADDAGRTACKSTPHPQAGKRALAQRRTIHRGVAKNI